MSSARLQPELGSNTGPTPGLPSEWEERATHRLAWLAGAAVVAALIAAALVPLREPNVGGVRDGQERPILVIPIVLFTSLAVYLVARRASLPAHARLDVGLVWLVALAAAAAVFRHWLPYAPTDAVRGPSIISVGVLFFAAMVPVRPGRMLLTAAAAALMDPLGLILSIQLKDNPVPRFNMWLWLFVPGTVACALSVAASRTMHTLGQTVRRAMDMGSYRLVEKLGAGGMGEVWLAQHNMLARPAAIKLIKAEALGEEEPEQVQDMMRRFEREAQATARLSSPHTIEIYDFGLARDGSFYYVMELLDGMDLHRLVKRHGALPSPRVASLLLQACHSLRDAHAAGMIHRDVKPANIYLCRKGLDHDVVKVLDFGLVKLQRGTEDTEGSVAEGIKGTPAYMPPEMAQPGVELDGRTDIYSLGCVAFWLLTGEQVFPADNMVQAIYAHATQAPRRPSEVSGADVDARLEELVLRCLAKDRADRPRDCDEIMQALLATGLASDWTAEHARAWWEGKVGPPLAPGFVEAMERPPSSAATVILATQSLLER